MKKLQEWILPAQVQLKQDNLEMDGCKVVCGAGRPCTVIR